MLIGYRVSNWQVLPKPCSYSFLLLAFVLFHQEVKLSDVHASLAIFYSVSVPIVKVLDTEVMCISASEADKYYTQI